MIYGMINILHLLFRLISHPLKVAMQKLFYVYLLITIASSLVAKADSLPGQFTLTRDSDREWTASYCFDIAVNAFEFERPMSGNMRQDYWQVTNDLFELQYEDINQESAAIIQRKDGAVFRCTSISMQTYTDLPEKNYLAFSTFSDGGVTVYTGYFSGSVKINSNWQKTELTAQYVPLTGNNILARDIHSLDPQYIYFGPQKSVERDGSITVIDPAIPSTAREMILSTMPQVNIEIGTLFGAVQSTPFIVLMAGGELQSVSGISMKAGVQKNQVAYTLKGKGIIKIANKNPSWFAKHAAHEVIHLWQGEVWNNLGEDHPRMHEGSADALAYEFMHRRGFYTEEQYQKVWQKAESKCTALLEKSSIHEGPSNGNFDIVYQCGAIVNRLAGALVNPSNPGQGIWTFWGRMAERQKNNQNSSESEQLFFEALSSFDVKPDKQTALQRFLERKPEDPASALGTLKQALGISAAN